MAIKVSADTVRKQHDSWVASYEDNNMRGKECVTFAVGEQWRPQDVDLRILNNKESLTFNLCKKHLQRVRSQSKQIEFGLNLSAKNREDFDIEETNTFRMLLQQVLLGNKTLKVCSDTLEKCIDYGYSFVEINFDYEDYETLNAVPCLKYHADPSIAFWDKNSMSPFKTDGRFCGLYKNLTKEEIICKYTKYKDDNNWLKEENNDVFDYWYRDYVNKKFYLLTTQVYKREDLITADDEFSLDKNKQPIFKEAPVCVIKFMRTCNRRIIVKPTIFPTGHKLPLVYHPALTAWTADGEQTFPFIHDLRDPQKLHNYINSQLAVAAKNTTADKWLMTPNHVKTKRAQESARRINTQEGAFVFDVDDSGKEIRREQSAQIPESLINFSASTKQEIDEISGALIDAQNSSQMVLSGVALDKIANNINLLQVGLFARHIEWVNEVCSILKMMIPAIYTEEREIIIKKSDDSSEKICINQYDPTLKTIVKNNIKDIDNRFHYEITAGPSTEMERENTLKAIQAVAPVNPQAFNNVLDIYGRCLKTPYSEEIARRWGATIDPNLIKFSQGEIDEEQFKTAQMQNMQQQIQMQQMNPQYQAMIHAAQAEMKKGNAAEFDAQTKRQVAMTNAMTAQNKIQLEMFKAINERDERKRELALEEIQKQIDINNQIIQEIQNANVQAAG